MVASQEEIAITIEEKRYIVSTNAELWQVDDNLFLVDLPDHVSSRVVQMKELSAHEFSIETASSLYLSSACPPTIKKPSFQAIEEAKAQVK